jgi:hypothetical protein
MRYLLVMLLAGCAGAPTTAHDSETKGPVSIVWHKTDKAWAVLANERGEKPSLTARGAYFMRNGVCHVFAPDPPMDEGKYVFSQWSTLGHEIKHCFDGAFHK